MYKYCICVFYCYITRFPDGQCREKDRSGWGLSDFTYSRNKWREQRRGAQCLDLFHGRILLWEINPSQTERNRQEGGRAEG